MFKESDKKDKIEEGIITSTRKVIPIGDSKGVTLSKKWLDIQKWLGKDVKELVSVADSIVILVPPGEEEKAKKFMRKYEKEIKKASRRKTHRKGE